METLLENLSRFSYFVCLFVLGVRTVGIVTAALLFAIDHSEELRNWAGSSD